MQIKLDLEQPLKIARDFFQKRQNLILLTFFLVSWFLLSLVINLPIFSPGGLKVGRPAPYTLKAPKDLEYVDEKKTEDLKEKARQSVDKVYRFSPLAVTKMEQDVRNFYSLIREAQKIKPQKETSPSALEASRLNFLRTELGTGIPDEVLKAALKLSPARLNSLEGRTVSLIGNLSREKITQEKLDAKKEELKELAQEFNDLSAEEKMIMGEVSAYYLRANYLYDEGETQRLRDEAASKVKPIKVKKLKGEVIVREGEIITSDKKDILERVGLWRSSFDLRTVASSSILIAFLLLIFGLYLQHEKPEFIKRYKYLALLFLLIFAATLSVKLISPFFPVYVIPLQAAGMLAAVLMGTQVAWATLIISLFLASLIIGSQVSFLLVIFLSGVTGIYFLSNLRRQSDLLRAGILVSLVAGVVTFFSHSLLSSTFSDVFLQSAAGLGGGLISGIATIGALPFLESAFRITTNLRLLEMANPHHPLLQELMVKAPGTYNHSVIVGNLAERAAQEVGANPILVRVGALYHDIGKLKRPIFFVENQVGAENPHDKTNPTLSHLIITSHVKDGVEIAKKFSLPKEIIDIIQEHHGTSILYYFFEKAKEQGLEKEVSAENFRYSGRKPQTKEAALIMLADSVEAAARTLVKPSPARLEQLIRKIITERLEDGQLDESHLTLGDLEKITEVFKSVLVSTYHARIDYPSVKGLVKAEKNAGKRKKYTKKTQRGY
jgi:hypothetical protein